MTLIRSLREFFHRPNPAGQATPTGEREHEADFALALDRRLRERPGNFCFSPFSVQVALAMAEAGARDETASQMREVLGGSSAGASPHDVLAPILGRLEAVDGDLLEVTLANSLWCQIGAPLETKFRDVVTGHFGGEISALDFRHNAEASRETINRWVEAHTRGKIRELLPRNALGPDSRLVLVNAIHFKGRWKVEFWPEMTRSEAFHLEGGGTVQAPLMRQCNDVGYLEADGYQAVELDYVDDSFSMVVLLPTRKDGLRQLEASLSARRLQGCVAQMQRRKVDVLLPRFEISSATKLVDALVPLGMTRAFTRGADFSGINGLRPPDEEALAISDVFHQAFVEVNEVGTEAAAATGLAFARGARPPPRPEFRADHPFLFAIRERSSGAILFLGRVADPTRSG